MFRIVFGSKEMVSLSTIRWNFFKNLNFILFYLSWVSYYFSHCLIKMQKFNLIQDHQSYWPISCTHGPICWDLIDWWDEMVSVFSWIVFLGCFELIYSIGVLLVLHNLCSMKSLLNLMWNLSIQSFFPSSCCDKST